MSRIARSGCKNSRSRGYHKLVNVSIARARGSLVIISLISVVLLAGCVGQLPSLSSTTGDLSLKVVADPVQIRSNEALNLFVDMENKAKDDITNVMVDVFDIGLLKITDPSGYCTHQSPKIQQAQIESLQCKLAVAKPENLISSITQTVVSLRARFQKEIKGTYVIDMLSLDEYRRLQTLGKFVEKPSSAIFADGQLNVRIEFAKAPPFVAGDVVAAKLYVSNTGPGFISTLDPKRLKIDQPFSQAFNCIFDSSIYSSNGIFPPITCIFTTPKNIEGAPQTIGGAPQNVQPSGSYSITMTLGYDYELRQDVTVSILKPELGK